MTKTQRLLAFLESGATATPKQIQRMFGIANPSAVVYKLRTEGNCIYANPATLKDGRQVTKYRIGTPSKAMVAQAAKFGFFGS